MGLNRARWEEALRGCQTCSSVFVGYGLGGTNGAILGASLGSAMANFAVACFTAGTPIVVDLDGNSRAVDDLEVGDLVLARSEFDPAGPLELKRVEEKFVRTSVVMELVVRGRSIKTTVEHPFYVPSQNDFVAAGQIKAGDHLISHDGELVQVDAVHNTDEVTTVYNLRVADHHTYFVGGTIWGWDVWVHNASYAPDNGWVARKQQRLDVYLARRPDGFHRAKHLNAKSIDEARDLSVGIGTYRGRPEASYLPTLVTSVASLEKSAAFAAIRSGNAFEHGGTRLLFHKFNYDIGFNSGNLTKWMRIELTKSGKPVIHSFPIDIASLRKYVPGAD